MPKKNKPKKEISIFSMADHVADGTIADERSPRLWMVNPDNRTRGCTSNESSWKSDHRAAESKPND